MVASKCGSNDRNVGHEACNTTARAIRRGLLANDVVKGTVAAQQDAYGTLQGPKPVTRTAAIQSCVVIQQSSHAQMKRDGLVSSMVCWHVIALLRRKLSRQRPVARTHRQADEVGVPYQ